MEAIFVGDVETRISLDSIRKHQYFERIDFDDLLDGEVSAPWFPSGDIRDTAKRDTKTGVLMMFARSQVQEKGNPLAFNEDHYARFTKMTEPKDQR